MSGIERIGVSLETELLAMFDKQIALQGYQNRSEALRDLIRGYLAEEKLGQPATLAVAGVFLVYDHHATNLSVKLLDLQHHHLLQVISSIHIHLDHKNCLEIIILRGKVKDIQKISDKLTSLKGVKLSRMNILTAV